MKKKDAKAILAAPADHTEAEVAEANAAMGNPDAPDDAEEVAAPAAEEKKDDTPAATEEVAAETQAFEGDKASAPVRPTLLDELHRVKAGLVGAEEAVYEELITLISEAKIKAQHIAAKVAEVEGHIAHDVASYFKGL